MANLGHDPVSSRPISAIGTSAPAAPAALPFNNSQANLGPQWRLQRGQIDFLPNLLLTTLAAVAILPPGNQLSQSAPYPKYQVQCEQQQPNRLPLGFNPQPQVRQLSDSAPSARRVGLDAYPNLSTTTLRQVAGAPFIPLDTAQFQPKSNVCADTVPNVLVLGYNPQPAVQRLDASAPATKVPVYVDEPLFHPLTLGMNPQPAVQRLDASAPPPKAPVTVDQPLESPLTLGINPEPQVQRLDSSAPPPKAPVVVDQPMQRPLTLGMNPQPAVQRLDASAPPPKIAVQVDQPLQIPLTLGMNPQPQVLRMDGSCRQVKPPIQVDVYPNLLITTLASTPAVAPFLPRDTTQLQPKAAVAADQYVNTLALGYNPQPQTQRLDASAPPPKAPVQVDQPVQHPLVLGFNPQPQIQSLGATEQRKYAVQADQYLNQLVLGFNPQPAIKQLDASAPITKSAVQVDAYPNLQTSTFAIVVAAPFKPVDTSQLQPKFAVEADAYPNTLVLGINPQPQTQRLDASAPPPKFAVQVDQPVQHPITLGFNPQPLPLQLDMAAPQAKFQVQVDQPVQHPLTLGINPQPLVLRLDQSAPKPQAPVQVDVYPQLLTTTLSTPATPLALPLGLPVDTSEFQAKFQTQVDISPNVLVLGYPPPPIVVPPVVTDTGSAPGWVPGKPWKKVRKPSDQIDWIEAKSGPVKRPGQVFGEEYPLSPNLGSPQLRHAVRVALVAARVLPPETKPDPVIARKGRITHMLRALLLREM